MNRISSSIIRELSSNHCSYPTPGSNYWSVLVKVRKYGSDVLVVSVHQSTFTIAGEFGVVYKAQYTEPEGEIGYKNNPQWL